MTKGRLRLAYCVLAAVLAAPLALGVKAQDAPAPQPRPRSNRRPHPRARRSTDSGLPHRHQLRSRRRHRQRSPGQSCPRSAAGRLRSDRGREAAVDPDVQADQRERGHRRRQRSAARSPQPHRGTDGGGARRRAAVRDFPRRLPRAAREQHARARDARAVCREPVQRERSRGHHVPVVVDQRRAAVAEPQGRSPAPFESSPGGSTTTRRAMRSKSGTCTTCRRSRPSASAIR